MTARNLNDLLVRDPFVPLKVILADGEQFFLATPLRAIVSDDELIVGWSKDPYAPPERRELRFIPLSHVRRVQKVSADELPRGE